MAVDGVVVLAHADSPTPVMDAYAQNDLHALWSGVPFVAVSGIYDCDGDLCLDGEGVEVVLDPHTAKVLAPHRDDSTAGVTTAPRSETFVLVADLVPPAHRRAGTTRCGFPGESPDGVWRRRSTGA